MRGYIEHSHSRLFSYATFVLCWDRQVSEMAGWREDRIKSESGEVY